MLSYTLTTKAKTLRWQQIDWSELKQIVTFLGCLDMYIRTVHTSSSISIVTPFINYLNHLLNKSDESTYILPQSHSLLITRRPMRLLKVIV